MNTTANQDRIHDFLVGKGLSEEATSGIMGNIQQESNFNPTAENESSGAYGIFQWLGGRKTALINYARLTGKPASSLETQLNFFWDEMMTTENRTYESLTTGETKTASEYAEIFESLFERSGGSALDKRMEYAEQIYSEYGSGAVTGQNGTDLKWWGDVVRVVVVLLVLVGGVTFLILCVGGGGVPSVKKKVVKEVVESATSSEKGSE